MKHRHIWAAAVAIALASPAHANPHVDRIIGQLKAEGFESFETERTWLGRIRIEAEKGNIEREIVLNRSTGEILRDYSSLIEALLFDDDDDNEDETEGEESEDGEEDDDDDDGEEDDDDDDESDDDD